MRLPGMTYTGPEARDQDILAAVPQDVRGLLVAVNGFVAFEGGLHIRGACFEPEWHSLRAAWWGEDSFHRLYASVHESDVPLAQDAVGDQWLLRQARIWRLEAETGTVESTPHELRSFLDAAASDPVETLGLHPLLQFQAEGGRLRPGQLLNVYPPFCTAEAANGVSLRAVPVDERRYFLADLARQLPPDGSFTVRFE